MYIERHNLGQVKPIFIQPSHKEVVAITEDGLNEFAEGAERLYFHSASGTDLKSALANVNPDEINASKASKALVMIQADSNHPVLVDEIGALTEFTAAIHCDIGWGHAIHSRQDANVYVHILTA